MTEYHERERFPIRFPFVEEPWRVLEHNPRPKEWDLVPLPHEEYETEHEPQLETKRSASGGSGAFIGKPPTSDPWPPHGPIPNVGGQLPGYRSFRYYDPSKPTYKVVKGTSIPSDANFWGVLIPEEYLSSVTYFLKAIRKHRASGGALGLTAVRSQPAKFAVTRKELDVAREYVYSFHVPLFLLDRACDIAEKILEVGTRHPHDLFIRNFGFVEREAAILCHRHAARFGPRGEPDLIGLTRGFMSANTFTYDKRTGVEKVLGGSIGQAYSRVLTGLVTGSAQSTSITGLNFLIGSDIPKMETYDLFFKFPNGVEKFPNDVTKLPLHII